MDGKIGVNTGQAGKEVKFPSVDSFFVGVSAMDVGRRKLVGKRNGLHVAFEALGESVAQDLQDWFESAIGKVLVEFCEGSGEIAFAAGLNGFREDCVRIIVVENHDILGAAAGGVQEANGPVAEILAGDGHRFGEHTMGSEVGIGKDGRRRHDVWWRRGGGGWRRFGGAEVLAILA